MAPRVKTNSGFYVMARDWQRHELFAGDTYSRRDAWCWLIEHARFKTTDQMVKGVRLQVGRGDLTISIRDLANLWGWSASGSYRFVQQLRKRNMIRTQIETVSGTSQFVITICNYELYQLADHHGETAPGTPTGTAPGTHSKEEGKEGKERVENIEARTASAPPPPKGSDGPSDPPGESPQVNKKGGARRRGRRLPETWVCERGDPRYEYARKKGMEHQRIMDEAEMFKNHWASATTASAWKQEWDKVWYNWVMRALRMAPEPKPKTRASRMPIV